MMNSPGIPLTIGLVLAKKAGVNDPQVSEAIEKSAVFFAFIQEKELFLTVTIGHGFRHMMIMVKTGWPRSFLTYSTSLNTPNISPRMSVACHGAERDTGHTGNFSTCSGPCQALQGLGRMQAVNG